MKNIYTISNLRVRDVQKNKSIRVDITLDMNYKYCVYIIFQYNMIITLEP